LQGEGFEPSHLTIAGLKSAALDHSANLALNNMGFIKILIGDNYLLDPQSDTM